MISQQALNHCFEEIVKNHSLKGIKGAIDELLPIQEPRLEPFSLHQHASSFVSQDFQAFVPAPDLLKSYQETFVQANQNKRIVNTTNYKLKANFEHPVPQRNMFHSTSKEKLKNEQPIMVQDMEQTILQNLKNKQIEATIPHMQQTLFNNELSHLQRKEVAVEHTLPLSQWKKIRAKLVQ